MYTVLVQVDLQASCLDAVPECFRPALFASFASSRCLNVLRVVVVAVVTSQSWLLLASASACLLQLYQTSVPDKRVRA